MDGHVDSSRVKVVQRQAGRALRMAAAYAVAGGVAVVVPHRTGAWLPLHLVLVGALLLAISGAGRLFAVTWSAAEPAGAVPVAVQRWLIAAGAAGLAIGREARLPVAFVAAAGLSVTAGLVLLAGLLRWETRHARVRRFGPALHYDLAAIAAGVVGTGLGVAMVNGHAGLRDAHIIANLLGLVGLTIAGTLPYFVATQARMKMSTRATPTRLHRNLAWLATALAGASVASVTEHPALTGAALVAYAAGLVHLTSTLPQPGRKQLRWAGPRLLQLAAGMAWWTAAVVTAGWRSLSGGTVAFPEHLVVVLVLGGYVQILLASLAYLAPVLRGGGHVRLSAGFATTRSWVALVAGNVAPLAWLAGQPRVTAAAIAVLAIDLAARAVALATDRRSLPPMDAEEA